MSTNLSTKMTIALLEKLISGFLDLNMLINNILKKIGKVFDWHLFLILSLVYTASMAIAKDYVIYSITQDFPMGEKDEVLKKNYYIDMGKNQGLQNGSVVDVYRSISVLSPFENKKRYNHKIKIGELKVLHAEDSSSIAGNSILKLDAEEIQLDQQHLMIGDIVTPKVK